MKITILGSCRQDSLYSLYPVTSIKETLTYPHYSKEIIQVLEFCKGVSTIPIELTQYLFRSGILEKRCFDPSHFKHEFDTTDLFTVEIASRISYEYKGHYAHHILSEKEYGFQSIEDITIRDLTDEEIERDIERIQELVYPKKMLIVSHIYTRDTGKRYELVKLLERICLKRSIPFFDPGHHLQGLDPELLYVKENLLSHYTDYGHREIGKLYKKFIEEKFTN